MRYQDIAQDALESARRRLKRLSWVVAIFVKPHVAVSKKKYY